MRRIVWRLVSRVGPALVGLWACGLAHAAGTLKGVVVLNRERGQPVANVAIGAEGANPTVSDALGRFVLGFPGRQPGDSVRVLVTGWAVVNEIQLERELPSDADRRPLEVIICKEAEREQWALQFYRLRGREAAEATYRRKLEELEKGQAANAEERARLRRERDQALTQLDELAKQLAAAATTSRSDTYQRASRLFLDGRLDEALGVLSEAQLRREAESATQAVEQAMRGYLLRGQLLALKFQFDDAARAYEEAVKLTPQHWDTWVAYGLFHQELNHLAVAEKGYREALAIARRDAKPPAVAFTLTNLGNLRRTQNRLGEARQAYEEALALLRALATTNPEAYRPNVATTLNNLGVLHQTQGRPGEARQAYEEALALLPNSEKCGILD